MGNRDHRAGSTDVGLVPPPDRLIDGFLLIVTGPIWQGTLVLTASVVLLALWYVRLRGL
ncbi:MAG: hypothetical protein JWR90_2379 [Marmoricola sp.]|jgi:hypothetical protein|nr:hypothetical protein [Marmoricola sp.]